MTRLRRFSNFAGICAALTVSTLSGGCDQGAEARPSSVQNAEVIRGKPIRSDEPQPAEKPASVAADASPGPKAAEPAKAGSAGQSKSTNAAAVATGNTGSLDQPSDRPAPLAKPDLSSFTRPKKLPKDDKSPVGVPDKDRPDVLCVNFDDLASFEYDPYETVPPDLSSSSSKLDEKSTGATHKAAEDQQAGPSAEPPGQPVLNQQLPDRILALNKKKIMIQGFMVPIEFKRDAVRSFLLVRNQMMCCFGAMMGMNEWVLVQMDGEKKTSYVQDVPTTVIGELEVGEDFQNGMVMSIYRLRAFEVTFKGGR